MKYTNLFAAVAMASFAAAENNQRGLATLAEKWNLTEPTFAYDSRAFNLTFPVTDYIGSGMMQYSLWTAPDCKEGGSSLDANDAWASQGLVENAALAAAVFVPTADTGDFSGREATVTAIFDEEKIAAADFYTEQTLDNQVIAEIRFCIRFGLYTPTGGASTSVEVNFLETIITLTVDLTDGFEIGSIAVEAKDRLVRTANQAYEVRGYECNTADFSALSEEAAALPRNQGQVITVCVTPEDEAKDDGIFMRSIDDFSFSRGTFNQIAIVDNSQAGNLLTTYSETDCLGSVVCQFSTILFAQFYSTPGQVDGAGIASMQFGSGAGRRTLRASSGNSQRDLQEDPAGAAEFDLNFVVDQADVRADSSASTMGAAMSVAAVAVVAALL